MTVRNGIDPPEPGDEYVARWSGTAWKALSSQLGSPVKELAVFDNGLGRGWSRVVEVDPRSDEIVWEYRAAKPEDFYSRAQGAAQRLPNGNTLITDSDSGLLFEVTPEGETVWEYRNTNRSEKGERIVIARARRLQGDPAVPRFELSD